MADPLIISIADVVLAVNPRGRAVSSDSDPVYDRFRASPVSSPADQIRVDVTPQPVPAAEIARCQPVFDSQQSWSLWRDGPDRLLVMQPPSFAEPLWTARLNAEFTRVEIGCRAVAPTARVQPFYPVRYPLDQLLLMHYLAGHAGFIIHAAGIVIAGRGYVFPGRSGAGKTTLTRQLATRSDWLPLSDDRVIVRELNGEFRVYSTPWPGEAGLAVNRGVPLGGMFFLQQAAADGIRDLAPAAALAQLLPVATIPWYDEALLGPVLSVCDRLMTAVPAAQISFRPTREIAHVLDAHLQNRS